MGQGTQIMGPILDPDGEPQFGIPFHLRCMNFVKTWVAFDINRPMDIEVKILLQENQFDNLSKLGNPIS